MGRAAHRPSWHGAYSRRREQTSVSISLRQLSEEVDLYLQHLDILQHWQGQLGTLLRHLVSRVQRRLGYERTFQEDREVLRVVNQWAKQQRHRQLECVAELWKLLHGAEQHWPTEEPLESEDELESGMKPQVILQTHQELQMLLRPLLLQVLEVLPKPPKLRPHPPHEPPPQRLLTKGRPREPFWRLLKPPGDEASNDISENLHPGTEQTENCEDGEHASSEKTMKTVNDEDIQQPPPQRDTEAPPVFEQRQQEFEQQQRQLQNELDALLAGNGQQCQLEQEQSTTVATTTGLHILQQMEQLSMLGESHPSYVQLQEELNRQLQQSRFQQQLQQQQQQQRQQQQQERELQLQKELQQQLQQALEKQTKPCEKEEDPPKENPFPEQDLKKGGTEEMQQQLHLQLHTILKQLEHLECQDHSLKLMQELPQVEEQRQILWVYLHSMLFSSDSHREEARHQNRQSTVGYRYPKESRGDVGKGKAGKGFRPPPRNPKAKPIGGGGILNVFRKVETSPNNGLAGPGSSSSKAAAPHSEVPEPAEKVDGVAPEDSQKEISEDTSAEAHQNDTSADQQHVDTLLVKPSQETTSENVFRPTKFKRHAPPKAHGSIARALSAQKASSIVSAAEVFGVATPKAGAPEASSDIPVYGETPRIALTGVWEGETVPAPPVCTFDAMQGPGARQEHVPAPVPVVTMEQELSDESSRNNEQRGVWRTGQWWKSHTKTATTSGSLAEAQPTQLETRSATEPPPETDSLVPAAMEPQASVQAGSASDPTGAREKMEEKAADSVNALGTDAAAAATAAAAAAGFATTDPTTQETSSAGEANLAVLDSSSKQTLGSHSHQQPTQPAKPAADSADPAQTATPANIRSGVEPLPHRGPPVRLGFRRGSELEALRLPKLPFSTKLPRALLRQGVASHSGADEEPPPSQASEAAVLTTGAGSSSEGNVLEEEAARPDGSVRLRIFDGDRECESFAMKLACVVFGSGLQLAHVADGTHPSVKTVHAALVFVPPSSYLLQPINGDVKLTCASRHAAISSALLRERRSAPSEKAPPRALSIGSAPEEVTRLHCCFQLGRSDLVFFLDVLPSAASVRALGPARHLLQTFVDGARTADIMKRRRIEAAVAPVIPRTVAAPASSSTAFASPVFGSKAPSPARYSPPRYRFPSPLPQRERGGSNRSPSMWRHDRVQPSRSRSRAGSPFVRQREPSSESLPRRQRRPPRAASSKEAKKPSKKRSKSRPSNKKDSKKESKPVRKKESKKDLKRDARKESKKQSHKSAKKATKKTTAEKTAKKTTLSRKKLQKKRKRDSSDDASQSQEHRESHARRKDKQGAKSKLELRRTKKQTKVKTKKKREKHEGEQVAKEVQEPCEDQQAVEEAGEGEASEEDASIQDGLQQMPEDEAEDQEAEADAAAEAELQEEEGEEEEVKEEDGLAEDDVEVVLSLAAGSKRPARNMLDDPDRRPVHFSIAPLVVLD
eukprot:TRINITY_DN532_c2_g1_i1.p1 TRINITY_DN532_c2_g1~~TRINITY_DN532_c2_g1_i1.p1  ORF type:complete len:1493 (-),score=387.27 TRINITY_DN532_c2_g1_i1:154-4566(-)